MKHFLMLLVMLCSVIAFTVYAAPPGDASNDIPVVFASPVPAIDRQFDVTVETITPEKRQHSFMFGDKLNNKLNKRSTQDRQPPNIVLLS